MKPYPAMQGGLHILFGKQKNYSMTETDTKRQKTCAGVGNKIMWYQTYTVIDNQCINRSHFHKSGYPQFN